MFAASTLNKSFKLRVMSGKSKCVDLIVGERYALAEYFMYHGGRQVERKGAL